jgi:elongation factor G
MSKIVSNMQAYRSTERPGANPWRIVNQIRTKLRMPAAAVQVPIGAEDGFKGVVDLVRWKSIYNQGEKGFVISFVFSPIESTRLSL